MGRKVNNADPKTFKLLNEAYSKDNNNAFYYRTEIPNTDIRTFTVLNEIYAKDKNAVYYKNSILQGADPSTFSLVGYVTSNYAKDKSSVFFYETPILNADPETFVLLADGYAKDKNHVYLQEVIIIGADPHTFKVLEGYYAKDKYDVYCGIIPLGLTPSEANEFRTTNEKTGQMSSRSYYSISEFINKYPSYSSLDTTLIKRVIIGDGTYGRTKKRKFIGLREVEP